MRRSTVCTTARFAPPNRRRTRRARLRHLLRCFAARNGASLSDDGRGVQSNSRRWSTETARFCRGVYECDQRLSHGQSPRSEEHTSELQSRGHLVCRLLLEKKKKK